MIYNNTETKSTRVCRHCHSQLEDEALFCSICGKYVALSGETPAENDESTSKICPQCNRIFESKRVFCNRCGSKLNSQSLLTTTPGNEVFAMTVINTHVSAQKTLYINCKLTHGTAGFDDILYLRKPDGRRIKFIADRIVALNETGCYSLGVREISKNEIAEGDIIVSESYSDKQTECFEATGISLETSPSGIICFSLKLDSGRIGFYGNNTLTCTSGNNTRTFEYSIIVKDKDGNYLFSDDKSVSISNLKCIENGHITSEHTPDIAALTSDFSFKVDNVYNITGKGIIVFGFVTHGKITAGMEGDITNSAANKRIVVTGIERFGTKASEANKGEYVALITDGANKEDFQKGCIVQGLHFSSTATPAETASNGFSMASDIFTNDIKTQNNFTAPSSAPNPSSSDVNVPQQTGKELFQISFVTRYKGDKFGSEGCGNLIFYDNRIEFHPKTNALGGFLFVNRTPIVYPYTDIASFADGVKKTSKSITLYFKNGEDETFLPTLLSTSLKMQALETLGKYVK